MPICSKCKEEKSVQEFHRRANRTCGFQQPCKICRVQRKERRERTTQRDTFWRRQEYIRKYKEAASCELCEENHIACLVFHHRNPQEKRFVIGNADDIRKSNLFELLEEISKCSILCANCHRKLHYVQRLLQTL